MVTVTISPKYQIVIPKKNRESLHLNSGGWLEYFSDGPNAQEFSEPLEDINNLIVPTIIIYEVFKVVFREHAENAALQAIAVMRQGVSVELTAELAMQVAKTSLDYKIPMADSIILTTANSKTDRIPLLKNQPFLTFSPQKIKE